MSLAEIVTAANELLVLLEAQPRGLKRRRHAQHVVPGRARIKAGMVHYFSLQGRAVLAAIRPHIDRQLMLHPREAITPAARSFAQSLLPSTLKPLTFAATVGEESEYDDAITAIIDGAAATLAKEMGAQATSPAADYLRDNSLSKLTGELN